MNPKPREPYLYTRILNLILGVAILILMALVFFRDTGTENFEMLIFLLAAIENFIGATVSFSERKKVRGNVYAIISALFLIIALILAVRYYL